MGVSERPPLTNPGRGRPDDAVRSCHAAHQSTRRSHILLIALLFLLSPLHLLNLLPRFSTHILGDVMDTAQYVQNEWWTAHALLDLRPTHFGTTTCCIRSAST